MADRAYLRVWTRNFSEATLIEQFVRFLATVPLPASLPEFKRLVVQSIDPSETPVAEWDLQDQGFGAAEVAALAAQHIHEDTAYFVSSQWDVWQFDSEMMKWERSAAPLELACYGADFDGGAAATNGHFEVMLGPELLFTGHEGLLFPQNIIGAEAEDPSEHRLARWMAVEANLREYHEKTRENIQQLQDWMAAIELALPVERTVLSSEEEDNLEARLDAILAKG